MSRTRSGPGDQAPGGSRAFDELTRMVNQGRSWSGRERNCAFLNTGGPRFATISAVSGLDFPDDGRAAALVDWDQDGDLDLWTSNRNAPRLRLLRNDARGGHFLALRLVGNGTTTNRDAIGARVELSGGDLGAGRLVKTLRAGEGFLSQSSKWLHFGLGPAARIGKAVVEWPGGSTEEFTGLEPDRRYRLVQGSGEARKWSRPEPAAALAPSEPDLPPDPPAARIPLVMLTSLPGLAYQDWSGARVPVAAGPGKHLLLNLWASWCAPCRAELEEIAARAGAIREAGIEVAALSVDGLGDDRSDPAAARALVERLRFPFASGRATAALVQSLQYLHDGHLALHRPLPVPASFLIDPQGRLSVIYRGRVSLDEVFRDRDHSQGTRPERWKRAAMFPGRTIEHPLVETAAVTEETKARFQFALDLERGGQGAAAAREYREVLRSRPDFAEAHNNLGLVLVRTGELPQARSHLDRALELKPGMAEAHFNLGLLGEREGKADLAEAEYRRALELKPGYPGAHNALGLLAAKAGRAAEARGRFAEEVRLHPDSAEAHNHLGLSLLEENRLDGAAAEFREAIRLAPRLADARNNLGVVCKRQGKLDEAAAQYREAVRIQPDFAEAHNNLGAVYLNQGKKAEARASFERALEIRPDFPAARANLDRSRN